MDFGPKGHATRPADCVMHCNYKARIIFTNVNLQALLEAAGLIINQVIALQETKFRKTDVRQLSDGTLIIVICVQLSVVHLVNFHELVPTSPGYPSTQSSASENYYYLQLLLSNATADNSEFDAFYERLVRFLSATQLFMVTPMKKEHLRWTELLKGFLSATQLFMVTPMKKEHRRWTELLKGEEEGTEAGSDCITSRATGGHYQLQKALQEDL
ncbi:unnamed protein product [Strongylus vulgaris]|uniref:Uncharacterized protein n=1 Tax=Strongylus vulgaris TaxID=40348 RepID=A0A3P7IYJ4_STRVU|nr:unnamed protein product [Strongylus vulgaris]